MATTTINPNHLIRKIHSSRKRKAADSLTTQTIKRRSPKKTEPPARKFSTTIPSSFSFARLHSSEPPHPLIPLDWGVKDQVRLTCRVPISWAATMSSAQVSHGTNAFVKASQDETGSSHQDAKSQFRESLLTWIHPALPLTTSISSNARQKSPLFPEVLLDEMRQDWQVALTSALQHLNAGQSPCFYLITATLTILFLTAADGDKRQPRAVVVGASDKLRNLLQKEGVQVEVISSSPTNEETVEAGDWLQGMGINTKDFSMHTNNHNTSAATTTTAAVLSTSDVHGLVNLLLNLESLFSHGVPSLLSPAPFEGATLRAARYKSGQTEEQGERVSFVEISGPMLPHNILRLHRLARTQHDEYAMKLRSVSVSDGLRVQGGAGGLFSQGEDCSLRSQPVSSLVYTNSMYYM